VNVLSSQSSDVTTLSPKSSPGNVTPVTVSNKRFRRSASMICTQLSGINLFYMFVILLVDLSWFLCFFCFYF